MPGRTPPGLGCVRHRLPLALGRHGQAALRGDLSAPWFHYPFSPPERFNLLAFTYSRKGEHLSVPGGVSQVFT